METDLHPANYVLMEYIDIQHPEVFGLAATPSQRYDMAEQLISDLKRLQLRYLTERGHAS